jgi:hypothetical protein
VTSSAANRRAAARRQRQPVRGDRGRCRQRDAQRALRLVLEEREQLGDGGGLAGARPPGEHADPSVRGHRRGEPLPVGILPGEQPVQCRTEAVPVDLRRGTQRRRVEHVGDPLLLAPVAVEVQRPLHEPQGAGRVTLDADGHEPAGLQGAHPGGWSRPGQCGQALLVGVLDRGGLLRARHVEVHRTGSQSAYGERGGEEHALVVLPAEPTEPQGHVHVGRREDAGVVEVAQQAGGSPYALDVVHVEVGQRAPRASRSDRSTTSWAGGDQGNAPQVVEPTTGVSGPHMPRRKRYSTPPRWVPAA